MIQIISGVFVVVAALAIFLGRGGTGLPFPDVFPLLGAGGAAAVAAAGSLIALHGLYRRSRLNGHGDQRWLRMLGLMGVSVLTIFVVALLVPQWADTLNILSVGGFPLGFYMAAQGCLIALAAAVFVIASKQDALDAEDAAAATTPPLDGSSPGSAA